ncbi:hypothetical protein PR048_031334 [Dryococelus australis]|uniref:Uncharacterized protein n=1 Tax=Dryococelus australis TaxID=614101 RepID=A0ABQ9G506_9NEOP|nr:hypothetical protein PR048_031334 [Dryococelus australis]
MATLLLLLLLAVLAPACCQPISVCGLSNSIPDVTLRSRCPEFTARAPELPWRSRLVRHHSGVREVLGSNPEQGRGPTGRVVLGRGTEPQQPPGKSRESVAHLCRVKVLVKLTWRQTLKPHHVAPHSTPPNPCPKDDFVMEQCPRVCLQRFVPPPLQHRVRFQRAALPMKGVAPSLSTQGHTPPTPSLHPSARNAYFLISRELLGPGSPGAPHCRSKVTHPCAAKFGLFQMHYREANREQQHRMVKQYLLQSAVDSCDDGCGTGGACGGDRYSSLAVFCFPGVSWISASVNLSANSEGPMHLPEVITATGFASHAGAAGKAPFESFALVFDIILPLSPMLHTSNTAAVTPSKMAAAPSFLASRQLYPDLMKLHVYYCVVFVKCVRQLCLGPECAADDVSRFGSQRALFQIDKARAWSARAGRILSPEVRRKIVLPKRTEMLSIGRRPRRGRSVKWRGLWPQLAFSIRRLACSPSTKANRVQSPAGSLLGFPKQETCRTLPLVGGFSRGHPFNSGAALYSPRSPSSALKTSLLRAAQISSLTRLVPIR